MWSAYFGVLLCICLFLAPAESQSENPRPRVRDVGIRVGILPPGPLNCITDVAGVRVGHATIIRGEDVRSGVTAVLPHPGNLFQEKVPGAIFVGNAFGKLIGSTQVEELGQIETPILLTSTLSAPRVADALIDYMLRMPGNESVKSINPIVGETNDNYLNDIRERPIGAEDVYTAIHNAKGGIVEEGSVGAGTGTVAFGLKGGIGTSSRRLPKELGGYTVGVLVQSNFGGILTIDGAPVGQEMKKYYLRQYVEPETKVAPSAKRLAPEQGNGSIMIVVATDAPLTAHDLKRLGARAIMGLARTGAAGSNESGDYVISFSTAPELRIHHQAKSQRVGSDVLEGESLSPLFLAVIEATEEAIYNSLFRATTMSGSGHTVDAIPVEQVVNILRKHNLLSGPAD